MRRSINRTSCPQLHVQDRRSRRTTITFVKRQSVSKNYFSLCKNISSAPGMCVEGRLKQEKIQGCWFVDGKVPSIRMQVKWETFFSDKCFFKQCDRVGKTNTNLHSL